MAFLEIKKVILPLKKPNFPENTLVYCNQGTILTLKAGYYAIYLDYVILSQIILANNCLPDLANYVLKDNEVIIYILLHNTETSHFRGIRKGLGFIMVREDPDEVFYSYGFDEERSKVLYSSLKQLLPKIFQGAAFEKHITMLTEEKQIQEKSQIFFFLPSTTDHKEKLSKFFGNVNLHPTDCPFEEFSKYSSKGNSFLPQDFDSKIPNVREVPRETVLLFMKHVVEIPNSNLV